MDEARAAGASSDAFMPNGVQDRLVSVHAKLLQLVESLSEFQQQIEYGGNEGMMGWQDILAKYSLLTSYTHSVFDLLVTSPQVAKTVEAHKAALGVEKPAYKSREEQRALASAEAEAWKRTLSQSLVHPGKTVDLDREFIVGVLLRTKQVPEVEAQEADLLACVPPISDPAALYKQLKAHDTLVDSAMDACTRLRSGVEDREFNWKARITGDDDDEEEEEAEEEEGADKDLKQAIKPPRYSTEALARFMREGVLAG